MRSRFMTVLAIPWVDKTIALVASVPFAIELYRRWLGGHVSFRSRSPWRPDSRSDRDDWFYAARLFG
jgi:hypothetical protein